MISAAKCSANKLKKKKSLPVLRCGEPLFHSLFTAGIQLRTKITYVGQILDLVTGGIKPIQAEIENASAIDFKLSNVYQGLVKWFREGGEACHLCVVSSKCEKLQLKVNFPIKANLFKRLGS